AGVGGHHPPGVLCGLAQRLLGAAGGQGCLRETFPMNTFDPMRRELLKLTAATGGALAAVPFLPGGAPDAAAQGASAAPAPIDVVLRVNGTEHRLTLDARTTLLDAVRP